ncbi:MAG: uroporphyrinogen-III synthase [Burkholderiaceae bacterium]
MTRPQPEAGNWVAQLEERGRRACALPLIEIQPLSNGVAITQAWAGLGRFKAVMFVSRFAVDEFFARRPPHQAEPASVRMWSTGPGSRAALLRHGVAADRLDSPPEDGARFDSEALWEVVAGQIRSRDNVLVVRGHDGDGPPVADGVGRDWLAQRLEQAGAQVQFMVAYQRQLPRWMAPQFERARLAADDGSVWLFTSGQALVHLARLLPGQSWLAARALATHPRIAQAVHGAGFGVLRETRPDLDSVVASIESFE